MSKTVLIVEKDTTLMSELQSALADRGFGVEQTTDGKGAPELIRKSKPDCVVLAVDLDAGQNGYIICKKLKSDDDLKGVPVIIIGDPKGFGQHQKLKTRAEDYVGKPLDTGALVEHVGNLVGFPPAPEEPAIEESFDAGSLMDEEPATGATDLPIDSPTSEEPAEADLAMVDSMFEDPPAGGAEGAPSTDESVSLDAADLMDDDDSSRTVVGFTPLTTSAKSPPSKPSMRALSGPSGISAPEDRELKSKLAEASAHAQEAEGRIAELETRLREVEAELDTKRTELETARTSTGGKSDKEVFSLKDSVNKKDKEILRLKSELNDKEKEIVELREKENTLDQQVSDASGEMARRDAQIKTLTAKADQAGTERKKLEQQLSTVREEARTANANLSTLQTDFDSAQARVQELEAELEPMRASTAELEQERQQMETTLSEVRGEAEALRSQLEERSREADEVRGQYEQAQIDLDSARNQLTSQATSFAEEIQGMRQRMSELETEVKRAEDRARKALNREKAQNESIEQVRETLRGALDTLAPKSSESEEIDIDELAEA